MILSRLSSGCVSFSTANLRLFVRYRNQISYWFTWLH